MIRRSLLTAFVVTALSLVGSRAQADFMIAAVSSLSTADAATAQMLGLTFTGNTNTFTGQMPAGGVSYNFLTITSSGTTTPANFTGSGSFTVNVAFTATNNGVTGTTSLSEVFNYNFTGGNGNLSVAAPTATTGVISPMTTAGVTFAAVNFSAPTLSAGMPSAPLNNGKLSTAVSANAVPEPASVAMLGMGLIGAGFVAAKRRRNG